MLATLRSNRGDEEVAFEFGPSEDYAHEAGALLAVHLRGEHYDGDHTHDFAVRVDGLWGRIADVISLRDHIAAWVADRWPTSIHGFSTASFVSVGSRGRSLISHSEPGQTLYQARTRFSRSRSLLAS